MPSAETEWDESVERQTVSGMWCLGQYPTADPLALEQNHGMGVNG